MLHVRCKLKYATATTQQLSWLCGLSCVVLISVFRSFCLLVFCLVSVAFFCRRVSCLSCLRCVCSYVFGPRSLTTKNNFINIHEKNNHVKNQTQNNPKPKLLKNRNQVDDVVDAIPVHLFCGAWGVLAASLFATKDNCESRLHETLMLVMNVNSLQLNCYFAEQYAVHRCTCCILGMLRSMYIYCEHE